MVHLFLKNPYGWKESIPQSESFRYNRIVKENLGDYDLYPVIIDLIIETLNKGGSGIK
jgi:hypothetical protein